MSAFNEALAIFMQAHGGVTVSDDAAGITQSLDSMLLNSVSPDASANEIIKKGGMGEEAITLKNGFVYKMAIDAEFTSLSGPWINRHPAETLTYDALTLYTASSNVRHKFPTGNACSWAFSQNKQGLRSGDLRSASLELKLLFKPTLQSQVVTPAALV